MIVNTKPRFYWLLKVFFPTASWEGGVIITFKPWIFCKFSLVHPLYIHELTHIQQQTNPYTWWVRYVTSPKFRLSQEIEAHRNEYRAVEGNREYKYKQLHIIADRLASSLYKNLVTKEEAMRLITKY